MTRVTRWGVMAALAVCSLLFPHTAVAADGESESNSELRLPTLPKLGTSPLPDILGLPVDGLWPTEVTTGDLGPAPHDDLVVANEGGTTITVLRANPDGGYHPPQRYKVGLAPSNVHLHDMNHDGTQDIVVMDAGGNSIAVLLNEGAGRFDQAKRSPTNTVATAALTIDDFNGDGHPDTAVSNPLGAVAVSFGRGDGTFDPPRTLPGPAGGLGITSADYDGDGDADIVSMGTASAEATVLLNNGDGTFRSATAHVGVGATCTLTGDVNHDGAPDVLSGHADGHLAVLIGNGNGTFQPVRTYPTGSLWSTCFGLGDIDHDGDDDVAVANMGGLSVSVLENLGNGGFAGARVHPARDWVITCKLGHTQDDGNLDAICPAGALPALIVYDGHGDGTFDDPRRIPLA